MWIRPCAPKAGQGKFRFDFKKSSHSYPRGIMRGHAKVRLTIASISGMSHADMSRARQISTGIILVLLTIFCVDATIDLWPAIGVQSDVCGYVQSLPAAESAEYRNAVKKAYKIACKTANTPVTRVNVEGIRMALSPDQALFGIVALFAALGGLLQSFRDLFFAQASAHHGASNSLWVLIRPFAAIALGICVYVSLRAAFLPQGNIATSNPYWFITAAVLVGLLVDTVLSGIRSIGQLVQQTGK